MHAGICVHVYVHVHGIFVCVYGQDRMHIMLVHTSILSLFTFFYFKVLLQRIHLNQSSILSVERVAMSFAQD